MAKYRDPTPNEDFYRILAPDGTLEGSLPDDLDDEDLVEFYRTLVQTRRFESKALSLQRRGEISIIARSLGEEAAGLGTAAALSSGDWVFPSYRQMSGFFYLGVPMKRVFAGFMGGEPETIADALPLSEEEEPDANVMPIYAPLAVNGPNAVGSAMYDALNEGENAVSMAYIGDGSTSEGDFHDAMNFAGVFDVPAIIVCQNNQWATSVPTYQQTGSETFAQKGEAYGVPYDRVDGNDVFAIYEKTRDAVEKARAGEGPRYVEAVTYRRAEHTTADEESVYRSDEMQEYWEERDPIDRVETLLRDRDLLDDERIEQMEAEIDETIAEAVEAARGVPRSNPQRMFDHHLHTESWNERHQRAELRRELNGENPFTDFDGRGFE